MKGLGVYEYSMDAVGEVVVSQGEMQREVVNKEPKCICAAPITQND